MSSRIDTFFQWVWRLNGLLVFALALAGIAAMVFVTLNGSSFKDARKPEQKHRRDSGLLPSLPLAPGRQKPLARRPGSGQPGFVCLAAFAAPDGGGARLCGLRRGVHLRGRALAVVRRRHPADRLGPGRLSRGPARHGHHHVFAERFLKIAFIA